MPPLVSFCQISQSLLFVIHSLQASFSLPVRPTCKGRSRDDDRGASNQPLGIAFAFILPPTEKHARSKSRTSMEGWVDAARCRDRRARSGCRRPSAVQRGWHRLSVLMTSFGARGFAASNGHRPSSARICRSRGPVCRSARSTFGLSCQRSTSNSGSMTTAVARPSQPLLLRRRSISRRTCSAGRSAPNCWSSTTSARRWVLRKGRKISWQRRWTPPSFSNGLLKISFAGSKSNAAHPSARWNSFSKNARRTAAIVPSATRIMSSRVIPAPPRRRALRGLPLPSSPPSAGVQGPGMTSQAPSAQIRAARICESSLRASTTGECDETITWLS